MKKAFARILCLLLGVNVFTACYGPISRPEMDPDMIQQELKNLEKEQQLQEEEEPEAETQILVQE